MKKKKWLFLAVLILALLISGCGDTQQEPRREETEKEEKEVSETLMEKIGKTAHLEAFIPRYVNQAIIFTGDDIKGDNAMFTVFLYIVIAIIAFVFAVTTSNTINKESAVIGTLRVSGYSKGELIRHYMAMPMLIVLIAAVIGNILGYTVFKGYMAALYYASYSLPTYVTIWNADAFVKTTVIPVLLMFAINFIMLAEKMSLSPLRFLRRDLSRRQKKKAFRLKTTIPIMKRFRMRILFQNIPQLQNRYPDNQWEEILGGCDFSIFLGCNDMTTATYYSDRTGEITVSVASIRKNFFTIRATDYVPEYSESRSIGKRQLLLPDEILRYPLDQGILIIRGHNVLRFKKMDYTEHADAGKLKMEKVVDHIPDWYRKWEKQQQEFQILDEQVYEASDPLEKNENPIKENDVQEPLTVNGAVQKPKNKKRTGNGNTVMKVDDLFVKKSKG